VPLGVRSTAPSGSTASHASSPGANRRPRCRSHATYSAAAAHPRDRALDRRTPRTHDSARTAAPSARGVRPTQRREAAVRDRPHRPLPKRRATRTPRTRRSIPATIRILQLYGTGACHVTVRSAPGRGFTSGPGGKGAIASRASRRWWPPRRHR
jgi:hypothetical protein